MFNSIYNKWINGEKVASMKNTYNLLLFFIFWNMKG
jgi:hypothetical protein